LFQFNFDTGEGIIAPHFISPTASSKGFYMIRSAAIVIFGLILLVASAYGQTAREQAMLERLSPIGSVCMAGDACAAAAIAAGPSGPRSGEEIYNGACMACHLTGASNAPLFGNVEQWAPRIATGMDALYASVFNGIEVDGLLVMPVKGLCLDCSDDELKATVDYMVEAAQ
jgi:cytochrome c5